MAETPAQRKANDKYRKAGNCRQFGLKFFPKDHDLHDWVKSQPRSTEYIMGLIRADMESRKGQR